MPKGMSLHIGLNHVDPEHYNGWRGNLVACVADAEDLESLAKKQGYHPTILTNWKATRSNVESEIIRAAETLEAGDIFLLTYSGHGGVVPDFSGDEENSLYDQTWCLYDGELIDDESFVLWGKFKSGVRVLILADSCHSGTSTREAYNAILTRSTADPKNSSPLPEGFGRYRDLPAEVAHYTYRNNRNFYDTIQADLPDIQPTPKARVRLLAACQDDQLARDDIFNGLFTGTLLRIWKRGTFAGNYETFFEAIKARMPDTQIPNNFVFGGDDPQFDQQNPFKI